MLSEGIALRPVPLEERKESREGTGSIPEAQRKKKKILEVIEFFEGV